MLIDEFEEVFSGLSLTTKARYAQDLRNLFDSHPEGVVFVVATAPLGEQPSADFACAPASAGSSVVQIAPVSDETAALEYATGLYSVGAG